MVATLRGSLVATLAPMASVAAMPTAATPPRTKCVTGRPEYCR